MTWATIEENNDEQCIVDSNIFVQLAFGLLTINNTRIVVIIGNSHVLM
jgi:hypothetical protein